MNTTKSSNSSAIKIKANDQASINPNNQIKADCYIILSNAATRGSVKPLNATLGHNQSDLSELTHTIIRTSDIQEK